MHNSAKLQSLPIFVLFFCSCNKVYCKQEVHRFVFTRSDSHLTTIIHCIKLDHKLYKWSWLTVWELHIYQNFDCDLGGSRQCSQTGLRTRKIQDEQLSPNHWTISTKQMFCNNVCKRYALLTMLVIMDNYCVIKPHNSVFIICFSYPIYSYYYS